MASVRCMSGLTTRLRVNHRKKRPTEISVAIVSEGVPEERRILNRVEDSRSYLTDHAVQALLPALPLRQGRQVWPPSRQEEMVVPALRISVHQPVSRRGGR